MVCVYCPSCFQQEEANVEISKGACASRYDIQPAETWVCSPVLAHLRPVMAATVLRPFSLLIKPYGESFPVSSGPTIMQLL